MGLSENLILSSYQMLLILLACGYIIWIGRPEWMMGIYMTSATLNRTIMFGPVAHTWVFLAVAVLAAISYFHRTGRVHLFPASNRWIIPWMGLWWLWIIVLIVLMEDRAGRLNSARNFLCYVVAPMPIFLLIAGDLKRAKGFAVAYIIGSLVAGRLCLDMLQVMLQVTNESLLKDPTLSEKSVKFLGLYNYHFFAYMQGCSLILIVGFFRENRGRLVRLTLLVGAVACAYFLIMAGSRQAIVAVFLVLSLFGWWMVLRQRGGAKLRMLMLLGNMFLVAVLMFKAAPGLLRAEKLSIADVLANAFQERLRLWVQGLQIFASSPVWGTGFKDAMISHNLFISTLADQGIVGMIWFIGFLTFFVRQIRGVWTGWGPKDWTLWRMTFFCIALFDILHSQASGCVLDIRDFYWATAFLWHMGGSLKGSVLAHHSKGAAALPNTAMAKYRYNGGQLHSS